MTTTTGERTFSTAGRTVVAPKATLIPPGTYTLRVGADASVAKADRPGAIPYVNVSFEVLGTASTEGAKNRRVFHRLFLMFKPGKDGVVNMDRENGLLAMAQALGTQLEGVEIIERDFEGEKQEYLNPSQVVEWVKTFSGTELSARIKIEKGTDGYADKNAVNKFLLPNG